MLAEVSTTDFIQFMLAAAAVSGATLAWRKAKPSAELVEAEAVRTAAETDLLHKSAQSKIIEDLHNELDRQKKKQREAELHFERELEDVRTAHTSEKKLLQIELGEMRNLNMQLQRRLSRLETRFKDI